MLKRIVAALSVAVLLPVAAAAAPITRIVVIGDSLSDQGNAFEITGAFPAPPYDQRASNGPVAVEYLAQRLGINLEASERGGTNYAVVGALTGTDNITTPAALANTGMLVQTDAYLSTAPVIDAAGTLFVVWGGANDLAADPFGVGTIPGAAQNLSTIIGSLYAAGGRQFLVPNMPNLGLTPMFFGTVLQAAATAISVGFNAALDQALDALELTIPDIQLTRFDTFGLLTAIHGNPGAAGFSNVVEPCLVTDAVGGIISLCPDPDSYLFWDDVHPTSAAHAILGAAFAQAAVPEPAVLSLLAIGLAAAARRRQHQA